MNILVVFPFLLHDEVKHGGAAQILRMTKALQDMGHSIFMVSLSEYGWPYTSFSIKRLEHELNNLKVFPRKKLSLLKKIFVFIRPGLPPHVRNSTNRDALQFVHAMTNTGKVDVVYLVYTATGEYLRSVNRSKCLVIIDTIEIETRKYKMLLNTKLSLVKWLHAKITYLREKEYEKRLFESVDGVVVISPQEKEFVLGLCEQRNVKIIPSMIDTGKYGTSNVNADPNSLLFFGSFGHAPNVDAMEWFCGKVFPLIRERVPEVKLNIVGTQSIEMIGHLMGEQINVVGEVEDLKTWIAKSTVVVSPIVSGGGSRIKNLETMAMGKALVTTSLGADGLPEDKQPCYIVADTEAQFTEAVVSLLQQTQIRSDIGTRARKAVEGQRDSKLICQSLMEWLEQLKNTRLERNPIK